MTKPYKVMSDYLHHNASNKGSLDYILTHENVETPKCKKKKKFNQIKYRKPFLTEKSAQSIVLSKFIFT